MDNNSNIAPAHKSLKIWTIVLVITALSSISFLSYKLYDARLQLEMEKSTSGSQMKISYLDQTKSSYKISQIKNLSQGKFEIKNLPDVKFDITRVSRVEGLKQNGCSGQFPEEVQKLFKIYGCVDGDKDKNAYLVGVEIKVENNSSQHVDGDMVAYSYYVQDGKEVKLRMPEVRYPGGRSLYYLRPYSETLSQAYFWVPEDATNVYITYGIDENISYDGSGTTKSVKFSPDKNILIDFKDSTLKAASTADLPKAAKVEPNIKGLSDAEVKSALNRFEQYANSFYYSNHQNFGSTTNACDGGMFADPMMSFTRILKDNDIMTCRSNTKTFAVSVALPESEGWWCVDSYGNTGLINDNLAAGDTNCR